MQNTNSNQSARELSHFAESAMAVKRVIMQHFSMKSDYMTKERPNIYHPSRSGTITFDSLAYNYDEIVPDLASADPNQCENHSNNGYDDYGDNDADDENEVFSTGDDKCAAEDEDEDDDADAKAAELATIRSIEEQLHEAARSLHEQQMQGTVGGATTATARRPHKKFSSSYGLGSIIEMREKLPLDDSDSNASPNASPFKKPHAYAKKSGLDANAKNTNVPSTTMTRQNQVSNGHAAAAGRKNPVAVNERINIRPEENWRYRSSNSNSMDFYQPVKSQRNFASYFLNPTQPGFRSYPLMIRNNLFNYAYGCPIYGNSNNNNNCNINNNNNNNSGGGGSGNGYRKPIARYHLDHQNSHGNGGKFKGVNYADAQSNNGIDLRNWRNECTFIRNCGMSDSNDAGNRRPSNDYDDTDLSIGLSPPSESLLLQRRMMRRSDIAIRSPPPQTASG